MLSGHNGRCGRRGYEKSRAPSSLFPVCQTDRTPRPNHAKCRCAIVHQRVLIPPIFQRRTPGVTNQGSDPGRRGIYVKMNHISKCGMKRLAFRAQQIMITISGNAFVSCF